MNQLLLKYGGKEDELFVKLCTKFEVHSSYFLEVESGMKDDHRTISRQFADVDDYDSQKIS